MPTPTFREMVVADFDGFLEDPGTADATMDASRKMLPEEIIEKAEAILTGRKATSYRDGLIIQIGSGLLVEDFEHTERAPGGRGTAKQLAEVATERHIPAVADAYQNIGKNTKNLARGNNLDFDDILRWANGSDRDLRKALYDYIVASVSKTARQVLPLPEIDRASLTFAATAKLFRDLLLKPSGGAYQQYSVASCLSAIIDEFGQGGVGGLRVETKNLNASDASSKVAGDIQIVRGNRVEEAFEVTANDWKSKVQVAIASARSADLPKIHIIASVDGDVADDLGDLLTTTADITVLDVNDYLRTLVAIMRKPARESALVRLYEMLDRLQPETERVNDYVRLLKSSGLAAPAG